MSAEEVVIFDKALECMSRDDLEAHQLEKLRHQLHHVREKSPFYRRKLDAARINPDHIRSMEDVVRIPFTEKHELLKSQADEPPWGDFACITQDEAVRVFQTSGTTGQPLRIMLNRRDWYVNFYEQFMHYRCAYGLTEKDVLYVPFNYGMFIAWWGFQAAMEKAGLLIVPGGGMNSQERIRALHDWGANVVCGTPSYLLRLPEIAAEMGVDLAKSPITKMVVAGEPGANVPATRRALESAWDAECFDDIGATEISNFGYECTKHQGTHVAEALFLAEVLDPETLKPVADGEPGELVMTNLTCESGPLIRYRMRDLVRFDRGTCACGRTNLRLDGGVLGRTDDMFHHAGVNIFPSSIQNLLHYEDAFALEYQLVVPPQGSGKHLTIRVEPADEGMARAKLDDAKTHLIEAIKYAVKVTPEVEVAEFGSLPRFEGKGRRVIREE